MESPTIEKDGYRISTERSLLQIPVIHHYLSNDSYWAAGIPYETVQRSIEHALCFGIYKDNNQVGFARVISDMATFAYLADVFVLEEHRGKGLSKWLMQTIMAWPELQGLRRWMLATRDAHSLYTQFGFNVVEKPERLMNLLNPDVYLNK